MTTTVSRLRGRSRRHQSPAAKFGRAKVSGWTLLLLVVLRCYAIAAIAIAIYAFFRSLH